MGLDVTKLISLIEEGVNIKNKVMKEIKKEQDATRRKKLEEAAEKALGSGSDRDLDAVRTRLFKL